MNLDRMFTPFSVAIVGASNDVRKTGNRYVANLARSSFKGRLYPVNRSESEILGLKSYQRITDIPGEVDLAIVVVPASIVPQVIKDCGQKGIRFAVVHTAGFAELGAEGADLQENMLAHARQGGTRIIGPNCMGIYSPGAGINTVANVPSAEEDIGPVAFVGQSGWVTENVLEMGYQRGLRFSKVVSIGNQSDLTIEDLFEYFGDDDDTRVIGFYVEGIKSGREFLRLAQDISKKKAVVVWKAGKSEGGARATLSHTGSIAGDAAVFDAALLQAGVSVARNLEELIDLMVGFTSPVLPMGNALGLLVEAGGGAVASADAADILGFDLPALSAGTQQELLEILWGVIPPFTTPKNPVDIVWGPASNRSQFFLRCSRAIIKEVDSLLVINYRSYDEEFVRGIAALRDEVGKAICIIPGHPLENLEGMSMMTRHGIPSFTIPERALTTLAAMLRSSRYRLNSHGTVIC
jgi:acyl-CoA synthetase (NDP forming)